MTNQDLRYMFAAAAPHLFDFTKNAKAILPAFTNPDLSGTTDVAINWAKQAPRHGKGDGIYSVLAQNIHLSGFLRSEKVAGKDLRSYKLSLTRRIDSIYGQYLAFGRFRGLRLTDSINGPLHILLRTIAAARLNELAGDMPPAKAAGLYQASAPRIMALMRGEGSWDAYLSNVISFCKLQNHSRWRKVARAKPVCLQGLASIDIFPDGQGDAFTNCAEMDFAPIRNAERKQLLALVESGDWDKVIAHIEDKTAQDDARKFDYLALFTPQNVDAVIIADLEAHNIKSPTKTLILTNFFIQWAYDARGQSGANHVSDDNFQLFEERLSKALTFIRPLLEGGNPSEHALRFYLDIRPHIWFDDKEDLDEKVEKSSQDLYPSSYILARRKLHFMVAKWGGSTERAWKFATELSDRFPENSMLACLPYYAIYEEYLMIDRIQGESEKAQTFLESEEAKQRLAPYRDRLVLNPGKDIFACYSIPIGWYLWADKMEDAWTIAQAVGGTYAKDGFFGTYYTESTSKGVEINLISMFGADV